MNKVIESQAQVIAGLIDANDDVSCHLFLENQHFPVNVQDHILNEVGRLKKPDAVSIAKVLDNCS